MPVAPQAQTPKKREAPQKPKPVEIAEDADTKDVVAAFNKYQKELDGYYEKVRQFDKEELEVKQNERDSRAKASEVQRFASDPKRAKHFQNPEFVNQMDAFYTAGDSLEKSFEKTCKLLDIKTEEGKDKSTTEADGGKQDKSTSETPRANLSTVDEAEAELEEGTEEKPKSLEDIGREAMKKVKAEIPNADKVIRGEDVE